MTVNRAARLQFAIHEIVDILADEITARVLTAIAKQEIAKPQPTKAKRTDASASQPRTRRLLRARRSKNGQACPRPRSMTGSSADNSHRRSASVMQW